jgi:hypothetical protein
MKKLLIIPLGLTAALLGAATQSIQDACGPFADVGPFYCPFVLELYYLGITSGTSATTFSPDIPATRGQAAVFVARGLDQALARSSRRAALGQWWTTQNSQSLGLTMVGGAPYSCRSDGADVWVANLSSPTASNQVSRVRASDGKLLEAWTTPTQPNGVLVAMGRVFLSGGGNPGSLYMIDPSQPAGSFTTVASNLGANPGGITFDGARIWTANAGGSVSIVTPATTLPWSVTTVTGFNCPLGMLYDGANVWMTDFCAGTLLKLDSSGNVLQTVSLGGIVEFPIFDGANIWVPSFATNSVSVVQASTGQILATLTGNGLSNPVTPAFDGVRVLVTAGNGDRVSLWKAADLTPLGFFATPPGGSPQGACSDGLNFWVALLGTGQLARF